MASIFTTAFRYTRTVSAPILFFVLISYSTTAQQLKISDFVLFGGNALCPGGQGQQVPLAPGCGVVLGSSTNIQQGSVGSYRLVTSTGNSTINANIYSGGTVQLANSNVVTGKITAANSSGLTGNILSIGSSATLGGNIDVNGNILIGGGSVSGKVTQPAGTTYNGPAPAGGKITGTPSLPILPAMPAINNFPVIPSNAVNINNNKIITPGIIYGDVTLGGNKTLTFNGTGEYVFRSIKNSGTTNKFVFDFGTTNPTGTIKIYVQGDIDLNKVLASIIGDGSTSRIYTETHGTGSSSSNGTIAFNIANGSAGSTTKWLGTVWAPYGAITIGAGTGSSDLNGALWSGTQVNILSGVVVTHNPLADDKVIIPFNPSPFKVISVIGAELTSITESISDEARKVLVIIDGYVLIDVIAKVGSESAVAAFLLSEGMTGIVSNGTNTLITTGKFPIANLLHLNGRGDIINFCRPVYTPIGNSGLIKNAGDTAIGSQLVRNGFNLFGQGVKIGVLSDSYNTLVTSTSNPAELDIATGELPGVGNPINLTPVEVLLDYPYFPRSDEGRAMLQIVHDLAPKAELAFRTGFISPGDFAVGIKQMQMSGCSVIVDDITFINEPFLQDGTVAKMVDIVKALGVTYFTSAGNFGNKSHEQNYLPVAAPAEFSIGTTAHNFSGTGDVLQRIKLKPGSYTIALQWEDDIYSIGQTQTGGTKNDFDLYLADVNGNIICGYNRDNTNGDPFEFLAYTVANTVTEIDANIIITRANAGTLFPRFKYIIFRGDAIISEYQSGASTIVGQANAAGAIAVAAINYFKTPAFTTATPVIASYSSIGGTLIGTSNRNKPDITSPDGVNTSVNMGPDYSGDTDPFSNFFGTSAAAPHAAATAALLIEGRKRFLLEQVVTPDVVKNLLQSTAINVGAANAAGAGLIQADIAMRTFASPKPSLTSLEYASTITPTTPPTTSFTLTLYGDYFTGGFSEASQVLFRGIAVPTTFVSTTQLTAIIPAFTGNPVIQVYTPPKATGDGGLSNSILFFSITKKNIKVTADSKTKKYGEQLPAFTSTILVNNIPLAQSGLTLENVGLQNLTYATNATAMSNVGNQYFIKPVRTFDLTNSTDVGLLEIYIYDTIPGILTIQKLPVQVIPNDKTLTYGDAIGPITFTYQYDAAIAASNPAVFTMIKSSHDALLSTDAIGLVNSQPVALSNGQPVALSNGQPIALSNGQPVALSNGVYVPIANAQSVTGFETGFATIVPYQLTNTELANISFLVSNESLLNARTLASSTKVVDFAQEAILDYNINPSLTTMVNIIPQVNTRGVLGAAPLANGQPVALSNGQPVALSNGQPVALSNGQPVALSNGQPIALSNGQPIALSNSFSTQANRIPVIIDQVDVANDAQAQGILIKSLNLITGLTSGIHKIIPGTLLNDNFEITYGLGKLTINPAAITVNANNKTRAFGEPNPTLTASYTGFKYGENFETSDITGNVSLTTTAVQSSNIGTYPIVASAGTLTSTDYSFNFVNGILTVVNNPCLLTRNPFTNFGSTANPGTATSLWLNIETKVSGQLDTHGKYLLFTVGSVSFNNITSTPTITNMPIPNGKIIADNSVSAPVTNFDATSNTWITKVPVGFSSTSDIFIAGVIINSSKGFVKKNQANSVVKGIFYSNTTFSDQWTYGIAAYQPQFGYAAIGGAGQITAINGFYKAGTPTTQVANLVNGASGGGGSNYTGSTSSFDNFTACPLLNSFAAAGAKISLSDSKEEILSQSDEGNLQIVPNPASHFLNISFISAQRGMSKIVLFSIDGKKVLETDYGMHDAGKKYQKRIDVSKLVSGIYLIQLRNADKITIKKIIISR